MANLVLFDIDGTLVRTGRAGVKAFGEAFRIEFSVMDCVEKLKFAGRTDVSLTREVFEQNGIAATRDNFDRFFHRYLNLLEKMIVGCDGEICGGVGPFMADLRALRKPPRIGLLTGNLRRGAEIKLSYFSLWHEFEFGGFADDHEDRDCIAAVAKQRGKDLVGNSLRNEDVVVIGDTPLDIRCARAINARVIAVATGGRSLEELKEFKPDYALPDLHAIKAADLCAM